MKIKFPEKYIIVKIYRIRSKSEIGLYHTVELAKDGSLYCDCVAGSFNKSCCHKNIIIKKHNEKNQN